MLETQITTIALAYPVTPEAVAKQLEPFRGLGFGTPVEYKVGREAIATCRGLRVAIEARRKELKADSLSFGRAVDQCAKQLTEAIEAVETPLIASRQAVDDERERLKRETAEAKAREERAAIEAELRAEQMARRADDERQAAETERDQARRAGELHAERARLDAERAEFAREQAESRALFEEIKAQRAKLAEEQRAKEIEEQGRALAERKLAEERQAELHRLEFEAEQSRRLEALRPDVEKIHAWGAVLTGEMRDVPYVADPSAQAFVRRATAQLEPIIAAILGWQP